MKLYNWCFGFMLLIFLFSLIPDTISRVILVGVCVICLTLLSVKQGGESAINNLLNRHKFEHKLRGICPKEEDES